MREVSLRTRLRICIEGPRIKPGRTWFRGPRATYKHFSAAAADVLSGAIVHGAQAQKPLCKARRRLAKTLKILLAGDNPVNALLIRELLRRRGHTVQEVTTGSAAVAAMEEEHFDLLLTDIHMAGMDGIDATRAIRANETKAGRAHPHRGPDR